MRGGAWVRGVGVKTHNNGPLSRREGPSVKYVFLQFEKVESGQIGVLLSSDCNELCDCGRGRRGEASGVNGRGPVLP